MFYYLFWQLAKYLGITLVLLLVYIGYYAFYVPLKFKRKYAKYDNVYTANSFIPFAGDLMGHLNDEKANKVHYTHLRRTSDTLMKYDMKVEVEGMIPQLVFLSNKCVKEVIAMMPDKIDKVTWEKGLMKIAHGSFSNEPTTAKMKARRKAATSLLGLNSASRYIPIMLENAEKTLKSLREKGTVDFMNEMNNLTFNIFTIILFGDDVEYMREDKYPYENADGTVEKLSLCEIFIRLGKEYMVEHYHPLTSLIPPLNDYNLCASWKRNNKNFIVFKDSLRKMVANSKDQHSVWAKMSQLNEFTPEEVYYDLVLLMLGGSETSSHLLVTIFYNLKKFPKAAEELKKEFDNNGLKKGDDLKSKISIENIQNLDYLAMTIKEALRVDPPIPTSFYYQAKEDIKICDVPVNKGTTFRFEVVSPHYYSEQWLNPYEFIPERFDTESEFYK